MWRDIAPKTYSLLKETIQQGTTVAADAVVQAGKLAKAAANAAENPQELLSGGVKRVGELGLKTISGIDQSRLKMKQSADECKDDEDDDPPAVFPDFSRFLKIRNAVSYFSTGVLRPIFRKLNFGYRYGYFLMILQALSRYRRYTQYIGVV